MGCDCINVFEVILTSLGIRQTRKLNSYNRWLLMADIRVIGSSEQVHVVDALAITGDEGRGSLRKVVGSWQTSFDPQMSEWGNPALLGHP